MGIRCADHLTPLYPQKLALTSPIGGGRSVGIVRSRTKATELVSYSFFNLGGRCEWVVNVKPRPFYPLEIDPVPIVLEAGWAPGPVWTGAENHAPTEVRSADRPARSQSL